MRGFGTTSQVGFLTPVIYPYFIRKSINLQINGQPLVRGQAHPLQMVGSGFSAKA
jgi:hypothetical protein